MATDDEDDKRGRRFVEHLADLFWIGGRGRGGAVYPGTQPNPNWPRETVTPRPPATPGRPVLVDVPEPPRTTPGNTVRDRPPKEARGPLPLPPVTPPVTPPAPVSSPVDGSTGRYLPGQRTAAPRGVLSAVLGTAGALSWVLGTLVFGPYFTMSDADYREKLRRRPAGPPRRRGPRGATADDVPPYYRYEGPWPYMPGMPLPGPIPLPSRRTTDAPTRSPGVETAPRTTMPGRPRAMPRDQPTVRGVPAPANPWVMEPGLGYDPFVIAPPTPRTAPRVPRAAPVADPLFRFPVPLPWSLPGRGTRVAPRPLTPQQPTSSPRPLTPQRPRTTRPPRTIQPGPGLTPIQDPVPLSQPQALRKPTSANPCTTERTARRRRQSECKRFTTKTIRVCADK